MSFNQAEIQSGSFLLNPFLYRRRRTRVVNVGSVAVGGENPIRIQSMTTTDTMNTEATVAQTLRLVEAGCEIVRITAPTVPDAQNLEKIKNELVKRGCDVPLVADIHFRPDAAMVAADFVEKVRINPGNFVDGKAFRVREYTDEDYAAELERIEEKFTPLVEKLKRLHRSVRIGTNHGSLSDRIMNRYGDTPEGMVESALEYVRVCRKNDYHEIILSMKASNPRVMIAAYRLLAARMEEEGMDYPFHLGVTEAGDGQDGRIKSAAGIGSLLDDGIGDTIRVSLTEDPEFEIPVARELASRYATGSPALRWQPPAPIAPDVPYREEGTTPQRRPVDLMMSGPMAIGTTAPIRVVTPVRLTEDAAARVLASMEERVRRDTPPEILDIERHSASDDTAYASFRDHLKSETTRISFWYTFSSGAVPREILTDADAYGYRVNGEIDENELALLTQACRQRSAALALRSASPEILVRLLERLKGARLSLIVCLEGAALTSVHGPRFLAAELRRLRIGAPLMWSVDSSAPGLDTAVVLGSLICDGLGDLIRVAGRELNGPDLDFAFNLLQACGSRIHKTEFISCPSCGRTLFDLQSTTERIKLKTGHLKGVRIAIMGCIVNGPGEMADADFGYVGGGVGKINLYVGKTCVQKSIPSTIADDKLIELIKSHGKWVDPPVS